MDFTILLYIFTFLFGISLDYFKGLYRRPRLRKVFIVWLFIFLCFGYMTGSDWRNYETDFNDLTFNTVKYSDKEVGFWFVFWVFKQIIPDFWIVIGLMKCAYLYTLIRFLKKVTPYYISAIAILMPISLGFMVIDNPLRYMCALIFVNIALIYIIKKKYLLSIPFLLLSFIFHQTTIFFFVIILCAVLSKNILKVNRLVLFVIYLAIYILSFKMQNLLMVFAYASSLFSNFIDVDSYWGYEMSEQGMFAIGNLVHIVFFICVLLSRKTISSVPHGHYIYSLTVFNLFFNRFVNFMDTGFRLTIPLGYFFAILIVTLIVNRKYIGYFFLLYYCIAYPKNLWDSSKFIPYSNSIPYILTGHKPYQERSTYNWDAYKQRTGKIEQY